MPLKLLLVEPSEAQAGEILQPIQEAGLAFTHECVRSSGELLAALGRGPWDVVLCAAAGRRLPFPRVLAELHGHGSAPPCIVIAPEADEELVVEALRMGAKDVVSMGRLERLLPAIRREAASGGKIVAPKPGPAQEPLKEPEGLLDLMDEAYGLHEVILDDQGIPVDFRFIQVNPAYERFTNLRAGDILGRTVRELAPDLAPRWIEHFGRVALSGEPVAVDDYRSLGGRTFSGLVFCPRPMQFAVLFNDVTESLALEATRDRLAAAVEQTAEGIFVADATGIIRYANPALASLLGLPARETLGLPADTLLPGLPLSPGCPSWQGRLTCPRGEEGRSQILACTLSPVLDPSGGPASWVGGVRDVTIEAETDRSLRQMEKMKALGEVAGGVSHDFNNLLTAIISAAELIEWQLAAESPIRLKLQVIYQAVMRARELNRQILAFSRNSEEKFAPFDLSAVVKEAVHLIRSTFPAVVEVRATLVSGLWTTGSGSQFHQVVMNIAINALQAMLPGGGILEIDLVDQGEAAVLTLRDSGCGMEPSVLDRIFEPFFTTKERAAGKGLGLSVVHGIVQNHHGAITVRSRPGAGSVFQVTVPCTSRDQPALEEATGEVVPNGTERILFVDDEEVLAALGKQGLQLLGYRVTSRSDSQEALEEFTHHTQDFDLLVTDLSMPGMSGVELTQQIRKLRPDLPAILVTGAFQDPLPLEGMSTPFAEVLLKPVTILDMAKAVRRVLNLRPARVAAEQPADAPQRSEATGMILLAEDSHTTRSLLRSWLVKAGYQVEEARDGQEAWEAMEQNRGRYSVLVTDIVMPRMDGLKLTAKVRELDPSIPILMLSSSEDTDSVKEALHLHVNEFLSKPFESSMLVQTVGRLCADQATRMKVLRSHETAQAVRMAQRAMEAIPEKDMPIYSISEPLTDAGGDVFRAFRREDGSIFFAIADVAGHSVISSYAVAAFLGMLTNFVASDLDLRSLAMRLNRAIQAGPFSEVPICGLFGHWDPRTGRIHLLNAGIPHALWHRVTVGATQPVTINGTPLGVLDEPLVEDKVLILAPGDRLLLGSDGFFDAVSPENTAFYDLAGSIWENLRATDLFQAINLVSEAARAHSGGNFGDDLLVVALEQPPLAPDPDRLNLLFPSNPHSIDAACDALSAFLDNRALAPGNRYDTLLAVREALSNAMIHGNGNGGGCLVNLWAAVKGAQGFQVGVLDEGQGFDLETHQPPDTESSERGRGIPLIRHFTRDVTMVGGELTMTFQ